MFEAILAVLKVVDAEGHERAAAWHEQLGCDGSDLPG
jgi:hypothetical protein